VFKFAHKKGEDGKWQPGAYLPMMCGCSWEGCPAVFGGEMPPGWVWLFEHDAENADLLLEDWDGRAHEPPDRNLVFCPNHVRQFHSRIGRFGPKHPIMWEGAEEAVEGREDYASTGPIDLEDDGSRFIFFRLGRA
jgi:hypothetical protein